MNDTNNYSRQGTQAPSPHPKAASAMAPGKLVPAPESSIHYDTLAALILFTSISSSIPLLCLFFFFPFSRSRSLLHTPAMPATTAETLSLVQRTVSVAPLVLLSAADHYGRTAKGTRKRVVGVLLGQNDGTNVRVSNSFAGRVLSFSAVVLWVVMLTSQSPSRKMKRTRRCGSWTTTLSSR